jgi:hypothetical protein
MVKLWCYLYGYSGPVIVYVDGASAQASSFGDGHVVAAFQMCDHLFDTVHADLASWQNSFGWFSMISVMIDGKFCDRGWRLLLYGSARVRPSCEAAWEGVVCASSTWPHINISNIHRIHSGTQS